MADRVVISSIVPKRSQLRQLSTDPDIIRFFEALGEDLTNRLATAVNANSDELDGTATTIAELNVQLAALELRLASAERRAQNAEAALQRVADLQAFVIGT